jgi:hypothetical protein
LGTPDAISGGNSLLTMKMLLKILLDVDAWQLWRSTLFSRSSIATGVFGCMANAFLGVPTKLGPPKSQFFHMISCFLFLHNAISHGIINILHGQIKNIRQTIKCSVILHGTLHDQLLIGKQQGAMSKHGHHLKQMPFIGITITITSMSMSMSMSTYISTQLLEHVIVMGERVRRSASQVGLVIFMQGVKGLDALLFGSQKVIHGIQRVLKRLQMQKEHFHIFDWAWRRRIKMAHGSIATILSKTNTAIETSMSDHELIPHGMKATIKHIATVECTLERNMSSAPTNDFRMLCQGKHTDPGLKGSIIA